MNDQSNQSALEPCEGHVVAVSKDDVPPDGGYGWICVLCCFLINAHTWGINSSYGKYSWNLAVLVLQTSMILYTA